jgi:hypothetical protein
MRVARLLCLCVVSAFLLSCGGGGSDGGESSGAIGERLLTAPHSYADASLCAAGQPGYAVVEGQCQKLFDGLKPPGAPEQAATNPPQGSASAPKPQAKALVNVTAADFYTWAQAGYPILFGGTYVQDSVYLPGYGTFLYRYYYATRNYLGILNGYVYVYGPVTGWTVYPVGALNDYSCAIYGCAPVRSFINWVNNANGVVVKDAGNENFAFYSDTRCLYSYARQQETANFCLFQGSAQGSFAGVPVQVMAATNVNGSGCVAVLADPYGRQIDIYTDPYGIQTVSPLNTYWMTTGCT